MDTTRNIFLSYADEDKQIAFKLREWLGEYFGVENTWLRDFDLNGGELIADAIYKAIGDSNWFILFMSKAAVKSEWVTREADPLLFRSLGDENFNIIVVRLDEVAFPPRLDFLLHSKIILDAKQKDDQDAIILKIADYIKKTEVNHVSHEIYVDRGGDADNFWTVARRNQIVFILGWSGIGKTSFVKHSASQKYGKRPLSVKLTRGHSLDLLARDIILAAHAPQPMGKSEGQLLEAAIEALRTLSNQFFLFIDDAEEGLEAGNVLLPYLEQFLEALLKSDIKMQVALATTRRPDLPSSIARSTDVFYLERIDNEYIEEAIERSLDGFPRQREILEMPELVEIVDMAGGYPLAAKLITLSLKTREPKDLLTDRERRRFELKAAQDILRVVNKDVLKELHQLILQTLALVNEPMRLEDIHSIKLINTHSLDDIQFVRGQLLDWNLIEHHFELIWLHRFIRTYYLEQISQIKGRYERIARDFGNYAYNKALALNDELMKLMDLFQKGHISRGIEARTLQLSNEIFRYALPAERLLRAIREDKMADSLPMNFRGTLREMVFYFYEEQRDYKTALEYAQKWLSLYPRDERVNLFQVRCHRRLNNFDTARSFISNMEQNFRHHNVRTQLLRERALIADYGGDEAKAEEYYLSAISIDKQYQIPERTAYTEIYAGIAELNIRKAQRNPSSPDRDKWVNAAVFHLELIQTYWAKT